ncbi:fibrinogen-related molecule [Elysia marginata]|uniref:Fibrinogen-related molecule n=1 Tax=Elysia marginata TaxID=1093978 RepID=A0AAV4J711_9GAST|nr:fibrinogen-related molecule [Elysia marginata]
MSKGSFIPPILILLLTVNRLVLGGSTHCTTDGRFGPNCRHQCHCNNDTDCDKANGSCSSSGCDPAWFGPACQYPSVRFRVNGETSDDMGNWLTDNNDMSCNDGSTSALNVTFDMPVYLRLIRYVVNETDHLSNISLSYLDKNDQAKVLCRNTTTVRVNDLTMDIACETETKVMAFIMEGAAVESLCSLHITNDTRCPIGWHGQACEHQCNCVNQTDCHIPGEGCPSGCAPGYSSEDCMSGITGPGDFMKNTRKTRAATAVTLVVIVTAVAAVFAGVILLLKLYVASSKSDLKVREQMFSHGRNGDREGPEQENVSEIVITNPVYCTVDIVPGGVQLCDMDVKICDKPQDLSTSALGSKQD